MQGVLSLRVRKVQIQQTAMTFAHREAVECALGVAIGHGAAMAPIDLALDTGGGFEADERALLWGGWAHAGEVVPHNGKATREALRWETLTEHDRRDLGGECQQAGESCL